MVPPEAPIGYRAAHLRVESELGKAREHQCDECILNEADEWSYDHADPHEMQSDEAGSWGAAYSLDSGRYRALCFGCHRALDARQARLRRGDSEPAPAGMLGGNYVPEIGWGLRAFARGVLGEPDDPAHDLRQLLGTHISAQDDADLDVATLWILGTHLTAHKVGNTFPRLAIVAPSYGAGKSTLLEMIARLSYRGEVIGSAITDALIPRMLLKTPGITLCIDEAEKTLDPSRVGATAILNSGWQRSGAAWVNMEVAGGWEPTKIPVFAPMAFAGNGLRIAPDLRERTLTIRLKRADEMPEVKWDGYMSGVDDRLRRRIAEWAEHASRRTDVLRPGRLDGLDGRDRDRWEVLLGAAIALGGEWPARAARLALADAANRFAAREAMGRAPNEQLAHDIAAVWGHGTGEAFVGTRELAARLIAHNPELWGVPSGRPLTATMLAGKLRAFYGVESERIRRDGQRESGYRLPAIRKVWEAVGMEI